MIRGSGQSTAAIKRAAIMRVLRQAGGNPVSSKAIGEATGIKHGYLSDLLAQLLQRGEAIVTTRGYTLGSRAGEAMTGGADSGK